MLCPSVRKLCTAKRIMKRTSKVTVTVSYQWFPEVFLVGPYNLSSTSTMPITN